jgi:hypothetical protein
LTTPYQKITKELKLKKGYYQPKYEIKRLGISEEDFIEKVNKSQLRFFGLEDEHKLINQFQFKAKATIDIIVDNILGSRAAQEEKKLLFYHWYERKYKKNIITNDVLYTLNVNSIIPWYNKFTKTELKLNIYDKLESHLKSERFPGFSIYYEYFYDFFPLIENFSFDEFKQKKFLHYLLELFPKVVAIDYQNKKTLWRFTDIELTDSGGDDHHKRTDRNKTHNPIIYNNYELPCFHPNKIGKKNYEYYKIDSSKIHTSLFTLVGLKMRNIENEIRVERNLPKIGEGWISETMLFYNIKKSIKKYDVIHHGSPDWLGLQHFDIYIPELKIAIEYQGVQHQKPIDYFGGEEAFKKGQERDTRKKRLCDENDCKLFYVFPDDDVKGFINHLKKFISSK